MAYVYSIVHKDTGAEFIGVTSKSVDFRWKQHLYAARKNTGGCRRLINALRKYGPEAFQLRTIAELPTLEEALIAERIAIAVERPCLNLTAGGQGGIGRETSDETRAKLSERVFTPEWRAALSLKAKLRQYQKRGPMSETARAKLSVAAKRRPPPSAETRAKLAVANRGRVHSPETRAKIAAGNTGKVMSAEARAKISAAAKERHGRKR
jgi:hypothetical protein